MRDKLSPCIYYTAFGEPCQKGRISDIKHSCKNCPKYKPRKNFKVVNKKREERYKYYEQRMA